MKFPDFANKGYAFLNGINTSSDRRSKDTLKVITTDIFRFPGNPSHECTRSERAVCEKLQSFHILKLQVYQREKMNKHSAKSQNTQHSISTANKKKSFTITTVSYSTKLTSTKAGTLFLLEKGNPQFPPAASKIKAPTTLGPRIQLSQGESG